MLKWTNSSCKTIMVIFDEVLAAGTISSYFDLASTVINNMLLSNELEWWFQSLTYSGIGQETWFAGGDAAFCEQKAHSLILSFKSLSVPGHQT